MRGINKAVPNELCKEGFRRKGAGLEGAVRRKKILVDPDELLPGKTLGLHEVLIHDKGGEP